MKKFTLAAVAALSLALPFAANAAKELRVAVNPTFPPFEFVNTQTNEITGFEMDLNFLAAATLKSSGGTFLS